MLLRSRSSVSASLPSACSGIDKSVENDSAPHQLREVNPRKFYELCRVHLAFLIAVPADFLEEDADRAEESALIRQHQNHSLKENVQINNLRRWTAVSLKRLFGKKELSCGSSAGNSTSCDIPTDIVVHIEKLINLLYCSPRLSSEGIFRRNGNSARLRQLRYNALSSFNSNITSNQLATPSASHKSNGSASRSPECGDEFTVYDIACALKNALTDLPEPLLTKRFHQMYLQLADLSSPRMDEQGTIVPFFEGDLALLRGRQLRGFQLLGLLLPDVNAQLLRRLLNLLASVCRIACTRMTSESLGCIFGPLLLCPLSRCGGAGSSKSNARSTCRLELNQVALANRAVAFMIEHNESLFELPTKFLTDTASWLRKCRHVELTDGSVSPVLRGFAACNDVSDICNTHTLPLTPDQVQSAVSDESLALSVAFANCEPPDATTEDTEVAVARLYAQVSEWPESARKRQLVKRFNASNGGLTLGGGLTRCSPKASSVTGVMHGAAAIDDMRKKYRAETRAANTHVSMPALFFADSPTNSKSITRSATLANSQGICEDQELLVDVKPSKCTRVTDL